MNISSLLSTAILLFAFLSFGYAQGKNPADYQSTRYRIAFQGPEKTYINTAAEDGSEVVYKALGLRVRFIVMDSSKLKIDVSSDRALVRGVQAFVQTWGELVSKESSGDLTFGTPQIRRV